MGLMEEMEALASSGGQPTAATPEPTEEEVAAAQESDTLWSGENVDDYFGGAYHGKAKVEQQYHQYMSRVNKLFNQDSVRDGVIKALHVDNPVRAVTELSLGIVSKVDMAMQKTGEVMSDEVRMFCANQIVGKICNIGENVNVAMLSSEEKEVAFSEAVREHISRKIQSGEIDAQKMADVNGASIEGMSIEQRKDLHRRLIELDMKAGQVAAKYGEDTRPPESTPGTPNPTSEMSRRTSNPAQQASGGLLGGDV